MKYAAIDINFDSLGEAYGFPSNYRDPSFFEVADRFLEIARKYDFKYSIYVVGRDLEKKENGDRVREWARQGHEIGNHSWSHPMDLGALSRDEIYREVMLSHKIITETVGYEPKGFISPAWNTSSKLHKVLSDLGYEYDTSNFPSWLIIPAMLKNLYNHMGSRKFFKIINRRDFFVNIFGQRKAFRSGKLTFMPLPTNKFRMACWHTLTFIWGWEFHEHQIRLSLRDNEIFYYLIHPADLFDTNDLDPSRRMLLERVDVPLKKKIHLLERAIETILASGRKIITMSELAKKV